MANRKKHDLKQSGDWVYSPYITRKGKRIYRRDGKMWRFPRTR